MDPDIKFWMRVVSRSVSGSGSARSAARHLPVFDQVIVSTTLRSDTESPDVVIAAGVCVRIELNNAVMINLTKGQ